MDDLIEALTIIRKYENNQFPTSCDHDVLYVALDTEEHPVSKEDLKRLNELGFFPDDENGGGFMSYTFGSC